MNTNTHILLMSSTVLLLILIVNYAPQNTQAFLGYALGGIVLNIVTRSHFKSKEET